MVDLSQLKNKKRKRLGTPPGMEKAGENLSAPEHAPATPATGESKKARLKRRTGRTEPFATRVSPEFHRRLRLLAAQDNLKLVELLEKAIDAYEATRKP
jgi:hypothetical protein